MLEFLKTATIADVAETKAAHKGGVRKQRNPESGLKIRVFRDGSVYPSAALMSKFGLEYQAKEAKDQGQGFDVVDTALYPTFQSAKRILVVSPVSRTAGKVDLFSSTSYDEKGEPKASVMDQGAKTYGKDDLLPSIEEIYGISLDEENDHVDLVLVPNPATGEPWELPGGKTVTFLPKKVSRGKDKGTISTTRREKPQFYALLPVSWLEPEGESASEETETQEGTSNEQQEVESSPFAPATAEA